MHDCVALRLLLLMLESSFWPVNLPITFLALMVPPGLTQSTRSKCQLIFCRALEGVTLVVSVLFGSNWQQEVAVLMITPPMAGTE